MSPLTGILGLERGGVVAVVGCGGKTSCVNLLAEQNRHRKVLVSPTTQIFPMRGEDVVLCEDMEQCAVHRPRNGVQCMGVSLRNGKLGALPDAFLRRIVSGYDLALLEADGSRGLPCKGWLENEPVIPEFCTHTVGVVTLGVLGKPADGSNVMRLSKFLELTGLREGEPITPQAIADMVCAPGGMFRGAVGIRCLIVNQVEAEAAAKAAAKWLSGLGARYPGRFARLVYGSAHKNEWQVVQVGM